MTIGTHFAAVALNKQEWLAFRQARRSSTRRLLATASSRIASLPSTNLREEDKMESSIVNRRTVGFGLAAMLAAPALLTVARAQTKDSKFSDGVIRIGVLNDRSGLYADMSGEGSVVAARMAAEKFGHKVLGVPVDIVAADHQNKPDIGLGIARKWYDADGVDVIIDICNSAVSLAINELVRDRKKLFLDNSASAALSGKACATRAIQWQYSDYAAASSVVTKDMIDGGTNTFFVIAVDYALGESISNTFKAAVQRAGGKIAGEVRHPLNTPDMSSYLLRAKASGAKAVMLANAGSDLAGAIRQAREFGLTPGVQLLAAAMTTDVIESNGLDVMQGVQLVSQYNIYRDAVSIAWAKEFSARHNRKVPSGLQAASYSGVLNYLKAIESVGTDDADTVLAKLKETTINDVFSTNGHIRADGLMSHDMYLSRIKAPGESKGTGDYFNVLKVLPGDVANVPLAESACPLVRT
jgi:branched-chain amino acid transport system substrate-binding protein